MATAKGYSVKQTHQFNNAIHNNVASRRQVRNYGNLYRPGLRAWGVAGGETGLVQFESGATEVQFFAGDQTSASGIVSACDADNNLLAFFELDAVDLMDVVEPFFFAGIGVIDHITLENTGSGLSAIDDFGYSSVAAVPLPAAVWMLGTALAVLGLNVRKHATAQSPPGAGSPAPGLPQQQGNGKTIQWIYR